MNAFLSERRALYGLAAFLLPTLVFHGLVLGGVLPAALVWGGRLREPGQMVWAEAGALLLTLLLLATVLGQLAWIPLRIPPWGRSIVFALMGLLFLSNTAGNLASQNMLERSLFTPLTLLLALLSLRVALSCATRSGKHSEEASD